MLVQKIAGLLVFSAFGYAAEGGTSVGFQVVSTGEILEVRVGESALKVKKWGAGDPIVMMSGGGQSAERFNAIGPIIAESGYTVLAVNRRGIGGSTGRLENLTLHDYADDIASVVHRLAGGRAHILGWAYGNRVARTVATDHPDIVNSLTLLAAGGKVPPTDEAAAALRELGSPDLLEKSMPEILRLLGTAFFSPRSDARLWLEDSGIWPSARRAEQIANANTPVDEWWAGGSAPMLVVQGVDDMAAPPGNGRLLNESFAERVELVEIDRAGHALLLERPDVVAGAIVRFLQKHPLE